MTNEEEKEPTKYKVIFEGCNHERIMSAAELLNPAKQVCERSTTYKEDYYLCWSCLKEERGACSIFFHPEIEMKSCIGYKK